MNLTCKRKSRSFGSDICVFKTKSYKECVKFSHVTNTDTYYYWFNWLVNNELLVDQFD